MQPLHVSKGLPEGRCLLGHPRWGGQLAGSEGEEEPGSSTASRGTCREQGLGDGQFMKNTPGRERPPGGQEDQRAQEVWTSPLH